MSRPRHPAGAIARIRRLSPVKLAAGIVLAGILLQIYVVCGEYISPWSRRIWDIRTKPAWERSGILSPWLGKEGTEFLGFLRTMTPDESVLIFEEQSGPYGWQPAMQYFLFPRGVVVCIGIALNDCIEQNLEHSRFVVYVDGQPTEESIPEGAKFIPYAGDVRKGLFQLGEFGSANSSETD